LGILGFPSVIRHSPGAPDASTPAHLLLADTAAIDGDTNRSFPTAADSRDAAGALRALVDTLRRLQHPALLLPA
jgi:hypothetical protein